MKISKRLETICKLVLPNSYVADVGADHGLVEKFLIDQGKCTKILAIENKKGPFLILKNSLKNYKNIEVSFSDGIENINSNITTLIIAGMGGINIVDILLKHKEKLNYINQIIVDPHRDSELVRRNLIELGYLIEEEKIIFEDKKYYNIINFIKGSKNYDLCELEWGFGIANSPEFKSYKTNKIIELDKKISSLKKSKNPFLEEINELENKKERLLKYGN